MKKTWFWVVAISMMAISVQAAEKRVWMSRKGGTLEAKLGGVQGDFVTLINSESKEIKLKVEDLSLADRQHLVEFGAADPSIITSGKPGLVEKDVRIDSSTFKRLDEPLTFPGFDPDDDFDLFETPHFVVGTAGGVRPQAVAETAERLWHGMAFQHMNFRKDWGDKRMLVLLVEDRDIYAALGKWVVGYLSGLRDHDAAMQYESTWSQSGSVLIPLPDEMVAKYDLSPAAQVINVKEPKKFRKNLSPFPTHVIAKRLLRKQMGGVSSFGAEGYFAITTGHAYFKEISLAGKSETSLLSVEGSQKDEISSKRGFEDGTSWARTLRSLVRSGKVGVKLEEMLKWKPESLTPERLVLIYSFAHYMECDSRRLAAFAKMIRRIELSNQVPPPEEIATIFGFKSVQEFDEDWEKFIKEGDFK